MMNYAVVTPSGEVENVIVWDGVSSWTPPEGTKLVPLPDGAAVSWTYDSTTGFFTAPYAPPVPPPPSESATPSPGAQKLA